MADHKIAAQTRTEFGKGAARRLRRDSLVPAVLYGHGADPVHLALPHHDTLLALRQANVLLTLVIDGKGEQLALPKQVQRDVIKGFVKHVDLLIVKKGEKVSVDIPLVIVGDAAPETLVVQDQQTILVSAEATHIPSEIEISIEGLEAGTQITFADIKLPANIDLAGDPETLAVNITAAMSAAQLDAELAGEEADAEEAAEEAADDAEA